MCSSDLSGDDDPGRIKPNADISNANFTSYLVYNRTYTQLSETDRENFRDTLPFKRTSGSSPGVNGYMSSDKTYSSGSKALDRSSVKSN